MRYPSQNVDESYYKEQLSSIETRYEKLKNYYYNESGKRQQLAEQRSELEVQLQKVLDNIDVLEKVRILLQKVSEYAREQSRKQIEALVTNCLQYIFDSSIEFRIEIEEIRGRPEAEFYVISTINGDVVRTKPQEARGGGVIDIISLALRIAMLQSSNLDIKGPIILDEPAKHVSDEYIARVADFLKQTGAMFGRQIIVVTHNKYLSEAADKLHRVDMVEYVSYISNDS